MKTILPLAFIGAGSMAQALIRGLLAAGLARPRDIRVTNKADRQRLAAVASAYGVSTFRTREAAIRDARTVVLATKPQDAAVALDQCRKALHTAEELPLVISVAAGIPTRYVEDRLPEGIAVVRAMPNTSCSVGESATALSGGRWAGPRDMAAAADIFGAVGYVVAVPEGQMDVVTGLSGSGPAYIYLMLEAMAEAGTALGLDPELSYRLALETAKGAAATVLASGDTAAGLVELRRRVTSPGGTTMAGLAALEEAGFARAVIEAVLRAAERATQLSVGATAESPTPLPFSGTYPFRTRPK
jgi:pyrroline-5-carboxylate reductase